VHSLTKPDGERKERTSSLSPVEALQYNAAQTQHPTKEQPVPKSIEETLEDAIAKLSLKGNEMTESGSSNRKRSDYN
jgi:hypothetical protein